MNNIDTSIVDVKVKEELPEWMNEQIKEAGIQSDLQINAIPEFKVYNRNGLINEAVDPSKQGKILIKTADGWKVYGEEISMNLLMIRKAYTGFVPRINEFGDIEKDENNKPLKDIFYTPEVDRFSTDNIALGCMKDKKRMLIGRFDKNEFQSMIKQTHIELNGKKVINPLFNEIKKNTTTLESYSTSWLKLTYVVYGFDLNTKEYCRIYPGASYGQFNNIQPYTLEYVLKEANEKFADKGRCLPNFINVKVGVHNVEGINYLKWEFNGFMTEDNRDELITLKGVIDEFNTFRFQGVDFNMPLQEIEIGTGIGSQHKLDKVEEIVPVVNPGNGIKGSTMVPLEIDGEIIPF